MIDSQDVYNQQLRFLTTQKERELIKMALDRARMRK
jgi:hypothetical protein